MAAAAPRGCGQYRCHFTDFNGLLRFGTGEQASRYVKGEAYIFGGISTFRVHCSLIGSVADRRKVRRIVAAARDGAGRNPCCGS